MFRPLPLIGLAILCACNPLGAPDSARITARPVAAPGGITAGQHPLGSGGGEGILLVPASYTPSRNMPLVVALHGAGGTASGPISLLSAAAEERGFLVLSVKSTGSTWDAIQGRYGKDIDRINSLLGWTFARANVDASRITLEGFSDGASYALGVGLTNGDLFKRVVAFSPGFVTRNEASADMPEFFVSHGTADAVLPFAVTSGQIVPALRAAGYVVSFVQFDGGHGVTPDVLAQAVTFLMH